MKIRYILVATVFLGISGTAAHAQVQDNYGKEPVAKSISRYRQATSDSERREVLRGLGSRSPETIADLQDVRAIMKDKKWDEDLFAAAAHAAMRVKKPELAPQLVAILQDEKAFIQKLNQNDLSGKSEREGLYRFKNVEQLIKCLGELKSKEAVPVLKEYLGFKNMQYAASEALGKIGDKSMRGVIRDKAYKGEEVDYGGMGLEEAKEVIRDLEDKGKKGKWPKIAKQLIMIKNPEAKPELKKLFTHELDYVRGEAASRFSAMVDVGDINDILAMTKNSDWAVRCSAIDAMKRLKEYDFSKELLDLLKDKEGIVRLYAAHALGYKKVPAAVPYLEAALKDSDLRVREKAYVALYILTGRKYDFAGKDAQFERLAEYEKTHPSFY